MRIAVIGGGPGGLYFAILAKRQDPGRQVTVWERHTAEDRFGFGLVFSDETLDRIADAGTPVAASMAREFVRWSDIEIHYHNRTQTAGGHRFAGLGRMTLLRILRDQCAELGVELKHGTDAPPVEELARSHDLVVAADGANSAVRGGYAKFFRPRLEVSRCRYMWLETDRVLDAFTFAFIQTEHGPVHLHAYPYSGERSTVIVETDEHVWRELGFDRLAAEARAPGESDERSVAVCEELFRDFLGGHRLLPNNSQWLRFSTVRTATWRHRNIVLLGDAAHTVHFSIGSGTKLAMDDAFGLAAALDGTAEVETALEAYEAARRPVVESFQRAAQSSLEWFESVRWRSGQPPEQFGFTLLTRSGRLSRTKLRARDPGYVAGVESWFDRCSGGTGESPLEPIEQPFSLCGRRLPNRLVADLAQTGEPHEEAGLYLTEPLSLSDDDQATRWAQRLTSLRQRDDALYGARLAGSWEYPALRRANEAGFDLVEIPVPQRNVLDTVAAARAEWPDDKPFVVRLERHGKSAEESVALAHALAKQGVDAVNVSGATSLGERIRLETGMPALVSGAASWEEANALLLSGRADLVSFGSR
ncbi:anthraniloyl-CoA monooxygenase [Amycolatopsis xylanica]|uniref:Anthraniloyl-CoA monooxygenase n=1 Tax=Amycolatopsis xylanica TaxID=589385 RepID=A0A1H2UEP1_9PSEU|nr:FAD-dependent monooxygenase [Amycolatopsis xylanica]SDW54611.1 anthraniloyl-CoA monooxygenase [Amycolatopsis xylanica]